MAQYGHTCWSVTSCINTIRISFPVCSIIHDDVIKWKHFPRYWHFVRGIHRSPVNSPHKGQWRGAQIFSLICAWINGWVNNRETPSRSLWRHCNDHPTLICDIQYRDTRQKGGLYVSPAKVDLAKMNLRFRDPLIWNTSLKLGVNPITSEVSFRKMLKKKNVFRLGYLIPAACMQVMHCQKINKDLIITWSFCSLCFSAWYAYIQYMMCSYAIAFFISWYLLPAVM